MDAIVIGAGMSGLNCATDLVATGKTVLCLEASDAVGGRVRTDELDGFLLDRGFQILLTAYSEVQRKLDLDALKLKAFKSGAMVRIEGQWYTVADPVRDPAHALASALAPVGTFADKLKVAGLKSAVQSKSDEELLFSTSNTAAEWLTHYGFSEQIKARFFKPFFSGVFLEKNLETNAGFLQYLYKMFSVGYGCLPEKGIGEIPKQLAAKLTDGRLRLNAPVEEIIEGGVRLKNGEVLYAKNVVLACDALSAQKLYPALGNVPTSRACTTFYFSTDRALVKGPWLLLNAQENNVINSVVFLNEVAPSYAPPGKALVSVTVIGELEAEEEEVLRATELTELFGDAARNWEFLRSYKLQNALPAIAPRAWAPATPLPRWLSVIGDFTETASLQGAMLSGAKAAQMIS